ncbi:RNA-directed DNA polymerase [Solimonas fluminis]|nr:reverse transcriptase domain-containing protein [Solimonas fluminis]
MPERVSLRDLERAHYRARRGKKPGRDMARFHVRSIDNLLLLRDQINDHTLVPSRTVCMVAEDPKAREIHAPAYRDRVFHHWAVPKLEALYEPRTCYDSYANRKGKGLLQAVRRVQQFFRQVQSGQGGGWCLKLDIANFFYSVNRRKLWQMLKKAMQAGGLPLTLQRAIHAALRGDPLAAGVTYQATPEELALVPPHKRLKNARPGFGLPIGNLLSQCLAPTVYLDPLDQFIKHVLKVKRYVRYVDDFLLIHQSREQLLEWQDRIEAFLREHLDLHLKAERQLLPLTHGCDFLGYVIYPTHMRVRRRVVSHAREAFAAWSRAHVHGNQIRATPEQLRRGRSQAASYFGHLRHAGAHGLEAEFRRRNPWISVVERPRRISHKLQGSELCIPL